MARREWTAAAMRRALEMRRAGRAVKEVRRELGVPRATLARWWKARGEPRPQAPHHALLPRRGELAYLHGLGLPDGDVAALLGVGRSTAARALRAMGLAANGPSTPAARLIHRARLRARRRADPEAADRARCAAADRHRAEAAALGWPEARGRCEAKILRALLAGPKTERELALATGHKVNERRGQADGLRAPLRRLVALSMVLADGRRPGKTAPARVYRLAPHMAEGRAA
jgi:hypothetical protein